MGYDTLWLYETMEFFSVGVGTGSGNWVWARMLPNMLKCPPEYLLSKNRKFHPLLLWYQKQISRAWLSNYIAKYSEGCNYSVIP